MSPRSDPTATTTAVSTGYTSSARAYHRALPRRFGVMPASLQPSPPKGAKQHRDRGRNDEPEKYPEALG